MEKLAISTTLASIREDLVMSTARCRSADLPVTISDQLIERGRAVLRAEQRAVAALVSSLDHRFSRAVEVLLACRGCVIVTGIGKAGIIGQKVAASLSSTGTPSYFMHPAEAVHGDLGSIRTEDIVLLLSYSGETDEVTRLLPLIRQTAAASIAITAGAHSTLATHTDLALLIGQHQEACPLGLAPSCSTTAMLALGDALALVTSEQRGFTREQFAKFHPAGGLGKQLTRVDEVMRPLGDCRVASDTQTVREVLIHVGRPGRRTGAIMLTGGDGKLTGLFTDSDLARLLESSHDSQLDQPVSQVMSGKFQTVSTGCYLPEATRILAERKISELPVVTADYRPLGIVDVTDIMSVMSELWVPAEHAAPLQTEHDGSGDKSPACGRDILPISQHRGQVSHSAPSPPRSRPREG